MGYLLGLASSHESRSAVKFDDYGTPYIDTPYVTNVIHNTIVRVAYWGWRAATKAAAPDGDK